LAATIEQRFLFFIPFIPFILVEIVFLLNYQC